MRRDRVILKPNIPADDRRRSLEEKPPEIVKLNQRIRFSDTMVQYSGDLQNVQVTHGKIRTETNQLINIKTVPPTAETSTNSLEMEIVKKQRTMKIGKAIVVDKFNKTDDAKYFFLTHAHSDHYGGLNSTWSRPIYCSQITAKLLPILTQLVKNGPVKAELLIPLPIGECMQLEPNLFVTLLDANHCPGSVMFLFEGASVSGGYVLCTGDIKADEDMMEWMDSKPEFKKLTEVPLSKVYLDNTYIEYPHKEIPNKKVLIPKIIEKLLELPHCYFIISLFKLGKEEILTEIARQLGQAIVLDMFRFQMREHLFSPDDFHLFLSGHDGDDTARFKVCLRGKTDSHSYTMWKQKGRDVRVLDLTLLRFMVDGRSKIPIEDVIHFDYTDHSSPGELKRFVSKLKIRELIPHACDVTKNVWDELKSCTNSVEDWDTAEFDGMISVAQRDIRLPQESRRQFVLDNTLDDNVPLLANNCDLNDLCPQRKIVANSVYKCPPIEIVWE